MSRIIFSRQILARVCLIGALLSFSGEAFAESAIEHLVDVHQIGRKILALRGDKENETIELRLKE